MTILPAAGAAMTKNTVVKATKNDIPVICEILSKAFDSDPFVNWMIKQDKIREKRMMRVFHMFTKHFVMEYGHALIAEDKQGAALWIPPNNFSASALKQLRAIPAYFRAIGAGKIVNRLYGLNYLESFHLQESHFYLMFIGTDPESQGKGVGKSLMEPILELCDSRGVAAYLEATTEEVTGFYRPFGFELTEVITIPKNGPNLWLMKRDPVR
ncbi:MAG: GNAT family N-acetyltransferase [bacterium]|nr:GNAT family N-acetyltransferase [bacterium]